MPAPIDGYSDWEMVRVAIQSCINLAMDCRSSGNSISVTPSNLWILILRPCPFRPRLCPPHPYYTLPRTPFGLLLFVPELRDQSTMSGKVLLRNPGRHPVRELYFDDPGQWKGLNIHSTRLEDRLEGGIDTDIFLDFIKSMLDWVPEKRKTAAELLKHPWLNPQGDRAVEGWTAKSIQLEKCGCSQVNGSAKLASGRCNLISTFDGHLPAGVLCSRPSCARPSASNSCSSSFAFPNSFLGSHVSFRRTLCSKPSSGKAAARVLSESLDQERGG